LMCLITSGKRDVNVYSGKVTGGIGPPMFHEKTCGFCCEWAATDVIFVEKKV
jgi:hypothetical protein